MNEYIIINTNIEGYDRFILCLSFESLLTYIEKAEVPELKQPAPGAREGGFNL